MSEQVKANAPNFKSYVSLYDDVWDADFNEIRRLAPKTASFLEDAIEHRAYPTMKKAKIISTPSSPTKWMEMRLILEPSTGQFPFTVQQVVEGTWARPERIAEDLGLDHRLLADFLEWWEQVGPHNMDLEPGVSCRNHFVVSDLNHFQSEIQRHLAICDKVWDGAWDKVHREVDRLKKRKLGATGSGRGRRRARSEML